MAAACIRLLILMTSSLLLVPGIRAEQDAPHPAQGQKNESPNPKSQKPKLRKRKSRKPRLQKSKPHRPEVSKTTEPQKQAVGAEDQKPKQQENPAPPTNTVPPGTTAAPAPAGPTSPVPAGVAAAPPPAGPTSTDVGGARIAGKPVQTPSVEVSGAYNYLRFAGINCHGGSGSITYNINDSLSVVGEVGGCSGSNSLSGASGRAVTYLFGPRINFRSSSRLIPYAQVLGGGVQSTNSGGLSINAFAVAVGGGLDVKVRDHISFRLAQIDYLQTRFGSSRQHSLRVESGIVVHFGSK